MNDDVGMSGMGHLVVRGDVLREAPVRHCTYGRLVDAHAERDGRHHARALARRPALLHRHAVVRLQTWGHSIAANLKSSFYIRYYQKGW